MATFQLNTTDPYLIYPATGDQAVIANRDEANSIALANDQGLFNTQPSGAEGGTFTDPNISLLDPGGYLVVDGTKPWYALAVNGQPTVTVVPGSSAFVLGPEAIAAAIVDSGLSIAIAEALANGGLSLLASPTLLYSLPGVSPPTTPGTLVGATIGGALTDGPYSADQAANDTTFNNLVSRPMATTVQKVYYQVGDGSAVPPLTQTVINGGAAILASIKPAQTASNTYADATITTTGKTCLQEKNNLTAQINALLGAGLTTSTLKVILWQEPNVGSTGFDSGAHYQNYLAYYGPAVRALGIKLVYDPSVGAVSWNGVAGAPTPSTLYDEIVADFYGSGFNSGFTLNGTGRNDGGNSLVALAQGHSGGPCPLGLGEWNDVAGSGLGSTSYWPAYTAHIQSVFQSWVAAGNPLSWLVFWMGDHATNKPNNLIVASGDFKVPFVQSVFDTFSSPTTPALTIAAGATVTLNPLNPSPGTQLAVADSLGYEIGITGIAGAGSTIPFVTVQMFWYPDANPNTKAIATQYWSIPLGVSGTNGTVITGRGPQYGAFLKINIHNLDSVQATMTLNLNSNGRLIQRDDWLWDVGNSVNVPTYTLAGATGQYGNQLGMLSSASIPASSSQTFLLGMFSGPVTVRFAGTTGGVLNYILNAVPSQRFGTGALLNETPSQEFVSSPFYLPRGPVSVTISNSDTSAHGANMTITSLD